jgi:glucokinase
MLYFTVSTGIGGGIIIDGQLYTGASGAAGELGHMIIDMNSAETCPWCERGCLESLASGTAIARRGEALAAAGEAPRWRSCAKPRAR